MELLELLRQAMGLEGSDAEPMLQELLGRSVPVTVAQLRKLADAAVIEGRAVNGSGAVAEFKGDTGLKEVC